MLRSYLPRTLVFSCYLYCGSLTGESENFVWSEAIFVGGGRKCAGKFWNCWPRWVGCLLENGDECGSEHTIQWRHQPGSPQLTRSRRPVRTHPVPTVTRVITRSSAKKEPPEIPWWVGLVRIYCAKLRHKFWSHLTDWYLQIHWDKCHRLLLINLISPHCFR